jgi:hypothetical protein
MSDLSKTESLIPYLYEADHSVIGPLCAGARLCFDQL